MHQYIYEKFRKSSSLKKEIPFFQKVSVLKYYLRRGTKKRGNLIPLLTSNLNRGHAEKACDDTYYWGFKNINYIIWYKFPDLSYL